MLSTDVFVPDAKPQVDSLTLPRKRDSAQDETASAATAFFFKVRGSPYKPFRHANAKPFFGVRSVNRVFNFSTQLPC
jgi:hypothetical protein